MHEVNKLRSRLKNIGRNVKEYRMTVEEARALVAEFDELLAAQEARDNVFAMRDEMLDEHKTTTKVLDGGSF